MRHIEYRNILRPSVEYLERCDTLMINSKGMAEFLGVSEKVLLQLASTDRIPQPRRLGLGNCRRWSVMELLEWIEADCPRRSVWAEMRNPIMRQNRW